MTLTIDRKKTCQLRTRATPQEATARLEESMRNSPIRTNKEAARKFLSELSMYDEKGQLKKEY